MSQSEKAVAAEKYRCNMRRSNALHRQYLDDESMRENYDRFANWQLDYLLPFLADLHTQPGYSAAIDFVMSDLAGIGISNRDHDLERAQRPITTLLPTGALKTLAAATEANARVLKINLAICRSLLVDDDLPRAITVYDYCIACREASSLEECIELVHLITGLGKTLKSLIRMPVLGLTLRGTRAAAHAAGFGALQEFLEKGYYTFRQIPDIDHFLSEIESRMTGIFVRIYTEPLDRLG